MFREGIEAGVFYDDDPLELAVMAQALTKVQVSHAVESGESDARGVANRLNDRLLRLVCKSETVRIREAG